MIAESDDQAKRRLWRHGGEHVRSQPIDTLDGLIKQLEGLRRDLRIQPPVIVDLAMYGEDNDTITINVTDDDR